MFVRSGHLGVHKGTERALAPCTAEASKVLVLGLIKAGANVNFRVANGCSALFFAVKYADVAIVKALISAGASCTLLNTSGHPVLANALNLCDPAIVKVLLPHWPASRIFDHHNAAEHMLMTRCPSFAAGPVLRCAGYCALLHNPRFQF